MVFSMATTLNHLGSELTDIGSVLDARKYLESAQKIQGTICTDEHFETIGFDGCTRNRNGAIFYKNNQQRQ